LRAPRSGRVREVSVSPGASVEAGRVLVVLE
jgi:biotin carboxyl carrier protein